MTEIAEGSGVRWDPALYRRFGSERSRPFDDLVTRIPTERPRSVVDLGCGPGDLTARLADRWPDAVITGIDSSAEMIERASAPGVTFRLGDVRDYTPGPDVDVLISNAVLQWVPGHDRLLTSWARQLPAGATLAFQVPGNFGAPSHRALREVAAGPRFADTVAPLLRDDPVDEPSGYATLLTAAGCTVDAWETTYVHTLPAVGDAHPVLRWMEGTALRPVHAALDAAGFAAFRAAVRDRLVQAYPVQQGVVFFPFRRIFVVARTAPAALALAQGEQ
jgi:trans-aconitate 2-methyltransferase